MPPIIIHFVCPNKDGFHEGEYVAYLLVTGHIIVSKTKESEGQLFYSFFIRQDPEGFILMDDPDEEWLTAVGARLSDVQVIKYPRVCCHCRSKGCKS